MPALAPAEPYPLATAAQAGDRWTLTVARSPDDTNTSLLPEGWPEVLAESLATAVTTRMRAPQP